MTVTADVVDPRRVNNYERWESEEALAMRDVQMSKFHVDRESDPFE